MEFIFFKIRGVTSDEMKKTGFSFDVVRIEKPSGRQPEPWSHLKYMKNPKNEIAIVLYMLLNKIHNVEELVYQVRSFLILLSYV